MEEVTVGNYVEEPPIVEPPKKRTPKETAAVISKVVPKVKHLIEEQTRQIKIVKEKYNLQINGLCRENEVSEAHIRLVAGFKDEQEYKEWLAVKQAQ